MDRATRPFARFPIDRLVRDASLLCEAAIGGSGITDQQDIGRKHWLEAHVQPFSRHLPASGMEVERLTGTIPRDEQAVVLLVDPAPPRFLGLRFR